LGLPAAREAIVEWFDALGVRTDLDQVLITSGATQALWLAFATLSTGSIIAVEQPTSPTILAALRAHPLQLRPVRVDASGLCVHSLAASDRAVVVSPAYHNPSGAHLAEDRRDQLAKRCRRDGLTVIEDLVLADLQMDHAPPNLVAAEVPDGSVISIGSMSKLFWAGLRLGWLRGPAELVSRAARIKATLDLGASVDVQLASVWLLERRHEVLADRLPVVFRQRDALIDALQAELPDWTVRHPAGGLSLWIDVKSDGSNRIVERMRHRGYRLLPAEAFDSTGSDDRHLRIPFILPVTQTEDLVTALVDAKRLTK
jgi:DNA-binding transcriptional MocR family regulator